MRHLDIRLLTKRGFLLTTTVSLHPQVFGEERDITRFASNLGPNGESRPGQVVGTAALMSRAGLDHSGASREIVFAIQAPAQIGKHLVRVGHLNKCKARILEVDDHAGGHRQDDGVQNISHIASFAGGRQRKLLTRPQTRLTFFNAQYK